ncbi:MAG: glycosyltransferase [Reinekea sp.]
MKIAIIHEWLIDYSGSEKVLEQLILAFPQADLFVTVDYLPDSERHFLHGKVPKTSLIQKLPFSRTRFRDYLPLMPLAVEQHDLQSYDVVISSNHAFAKGVLTGPDQVHICYCHSPIRYGWDFQHQYLRESGLHRGVKTWLVKWILHKIRIWDYRTGSGVDQFLANSNFIRRRIQKVYGRASRVVFPGVSVDQFTVESRKDNFYLAASRLVPYKRFDLIVSAFKAMPNQKLKIIGNGSEMKKLQAIADDAPNIEFLGYQPTEALKKHMQQARAFVFAAEEDFGIIPVEAQACGTPVIAYGRGGARDTVLDGKTGILFTEQTDQGIIDAVNRYEQAEKRDIYGEI